MVEYLPYGFWTSHHSATAENFIDIFQGGALKFHLQDNYSHFFKNR